MNPNSDHSRTADAQESLDTCEQSGIGHFAIECAIARRWPLDTSFLLCSIYEDIANSPAVHSVHQKEILAAEQAAHEKEMAQWLENATDLFSTVLPRTDSIVSCGEVPAKICEIARDWSADYILIGSHSFGLADRLALRGVAAEVLSFAPCTVEVVRFAGARAMISNQHRFDLDELRAIASRGPSRVLVATDLSAQSTLAVDWVAEQDWGPDCHLRVMTVFLNTRADAGRAIHEQAHRYTEVNKYQ